MIATGTTVVRALETVARPDGTRRRRRGMDGPRRHAGARLRTVDGLLSGFHEADASHLDLLSAAAGPELLARSYQAAIEGGYRWHEFGDSHLILGS